MKEVWYSSFMFLFSFPLLTSILFCMVHSLPTITTTTLLSLGNETDRLALLDFKGRITQFPLEKLSSWNDSIHFCYWEGVTCGRRHQRVTKLDLQSQGLVGLISPFIGNLTFLREIRLQNNSFSGNIPQEVGSLFRLQGINLDKNSLGGEIPTNLSSCSNLLYLRLARNKLVGEIPTELGSLSKLMALYLYENNLTGVIPPSLGNLSSLQNFSSGDNFLEGSIPEELGGLTSLRFLGLGPNTLTGEIPLSLYNLSSIVTIAMPLNQLHGSLPPNIGLTLPNLTFLAFGLNQFGGRIPVSLSNASRLEVIDIPSNNFVGEVPTNLGSLQNLWSLNLGDNNLGNGEANDLSFLTSLTNSSNLRELGLSYNKFGGKLPNSVTNLSTQLSILDLGRNVVTGSIPLGIGNLVELTVLGMEDNLITGSIPSSIGRLQKLNQLILNGNGLMGNIPSSLGNITLLYRLYLQQNYLTGRIPSSLGACKYLQVLDLSKNNLDGTIPNQVIGLSSISIYLDLSRNSLMGSLPSEVGNLKNIAKFFISENKLSGKIPTTLGECSSLEELYMNGNFFEGDIPSSLSSLKALQVLDLSRNNLSGNIPKSFENLSILRQLNLSFNNLEGEVPIAGIFRNASVISVTGNNKLCGGIPKLKLQVCSNQEPRKRGKSPSFKIIVPIFIGVVLCLAFLGLLFHNLYWKRKPRKTSSLEDGFLKVSYEELLKGTDGFASANLIGAGSFGNVYKGILRQDDKLVAVKVLNLQQGGASKSFIAECEALRKIRHRNLLKIITSCSSVDFKGNDFKALVFEFMANGSLENLLYPSIDEQHQSMHLNFTQRLNIAIDVATALDYLHHHCETPIVHCDLKPSNVLLDDDMIAHVGDFGLAKFLLRAVGNSSKDQSSSLAIKKKGDYWICRSRVWIGSDVSTRGDVYSYGILLLEMFTGRRPTDDLFKDGLSLHSFCKMALPEQVMEITDSHLLIEEQLNGTTNNVDNQRDMRGKLQECLVSVFGIGVACSAISSGDRKDMKDVLTEMLVIKEVFLGIGIFGERRNKLKLAGEGTSYHNNY